MKLTWHIVQKDLHRLWPWLALLILAIIIRYGLFWQLEHASVIDRPYFDGVAAATSILLALQLLIAACFVAAVIHADTTIGDRAFWLTRPIDGRRLLAAKTITVFLGAIALPLACLFTWWALHHYRACEISATLPGFLIRYVGLALLVFAFAIFTRGLAGLVVVLFVSVLVLSLCFTFGQTFLPQVPGTLTTTRFALITVSCATTLGLCSWLLYNRRRPLAHLTVAANVLACTAIATLWSWDLEAPYHFDRTERPIAAAAAPITVAAPVVTELPASPSPQSGRRFNINSAFSGIPADHQISGLQSISSDSEGIGASSRRLVSEATSFTARPPLALATASSSQSTQSFLVELTAHPPQSASQRPPRLSLRFRQQLRRIETIATSIVGKPSAETSAPYSVRSLNSPQRSLTDQNIIFDLLLVHPGHLVAPGVGWSESSGNPNDTDELGRNADKNAAIYASLNNQPVSLRAFSHLTLSVDDVFLVRRSYQGSLKPEQFSALNFHYLIYPLLGTFERTLDVVLPPAAAAANSL
jgi:hypothetical protein